MGKGEAQLSDREEEKGEGAEKGKSGVRQEQRGKDAERERKERRTPVEQGKRKAKGLNERCKRRGGRRGGTRSSVSSEGCRLPQPHSSPAPQPAPVPPVPPLALAHRLAAGNGEAGEKLQERGREAIVIRLL